MAPKPRILYLGAVNSPQVGALAMEISKRGHEVCLAGYQNPTWPPLSETYGGGEILVASIRERAPSIGKRVDEDLVWMREVIRVARPHVIHAHMAHASGFIAALAGGKIPLIVHCWGTDVFQTNAENLAAARYALDRADVVAANSQALRDRAVELGADPARIRSLPWGVDIERYAPATDRLEIRKRLGLSEGPVMFAPRGDRPVYNLPVVLDAFALLAGDFPDLQLVAKRQDDADLPPGLAPFADRLHFFDYVDENRMADFFRAADVCVSVPTTDGQPAAVLEAMASGCPCVISDLPWTAGMIEAETQALAVPIDAEAVASAVRRVLDEPQLAETLATNGRQLVVSKYDRIKNMDELSAVYEELGGAQEEDPPVPAPRLLPAPARRFIEARRLRARNERRLKELTARTKRSLQQQA